MKFTKKISLFLSILLAIGMLVSCAGMDALPEDEKEAITYVSLRINPEIELLADDEGNVIQADAVNEDGEVVLSVVELEGMSVEEAGAEFTNVASELGYLDPDGEKDTVYIDVESTEEGADAELEEKLHKRIRDYFSNKGINGKVSPETLEKYAEQAAEWGVSAGHTKLIMRVLDANPDMTDAEALELSVKELMGMLKCKKGEEKIAAGLKDEYRKSIDTLKDEFGELFDSRKELDELKKKLEGELTEEERAAVEAQIAELEAELKTVTEEYKEKLEELKDDYKKSSKEAREEYRKEAERRKQETKANKSNKNNKDKNGKDTSVDTEAPEQTDAPDTEAADAPEDARDRYDGEPADKKRR